MRQRRVAGAKVVEGDAHAHGSDLGERASRRLGVGHDRGLGDLELEQVRWQARLSQGVGDDGSQTALLELPGREVDGHPYASVEGVLPGGPLRAGLAQHPFADGLHQSGLFGERDEQVGRHQAALRVVPAQQRLAADGAHRGEVGLGLVVDDELALFEGAVQGTGERQAIVDAVVHGRRIELPAVAAQLLGAVHRHLGVVEQRLGVDAVARIERQADARREPELVIIDQPGLGEALRKTPGDGEAVVTTRQAGQQHGELITAPAPDRVLAAGVALQALTDGLQETVSAGMTDGLVCGLEAIEVDERDDRLARRARRLRQGLAQAIAKQGAVGQSRESVIEGQTLDELLGTLGLGRVPQHADAAAGLTRVVSQRAHLALQPDLVAGRAEYVGAVVRAGLSLQGRLVERQQTGVFCGGEVISDQILVRPPDHLREPLVAFGDHQMAIEHHDADRRLLEEHAQPLARFA